MAYARLCAPRGAGTRPGLTCFYDDSSAQLTLTAEARRIVVLRVEAPRNAAAALTDARSLGAYANYELFGAAGRTTVLGVATEAHAFTPWGDGYLTLAGMLADGRSRSTTRLAGWQWDMPLRGTSLAVGGIQGGDSLRPSVPLLGVRYGTNARLQPEVLRVQRPWVGGAVDRSSRADLFVDGLFRRSADVPYGPYAFEADALLAGQGQLQIVQTDQRGEQTLRSSSYYFAPQLLPKGMTDFAVDAGTVSADAGRLSLKGQPVATLSVRHGVTERHTAAGSLVWARHGRMVAAASDLEWGQHGVLRFGLTAFDRGDGWRARALVGHEFQSRRFSSLLRVEVTPRERTQPDAASPPPPVVQALLPADRRNIVAALTWNVSDPLQLGATGLDQAGLRGQRNRVLGLFASYRVSNATQITVSVQQVKQLHSSTSVQVGWVMPLGSRHLAVASVQRSGERTSATWSVQSLQGNLEGEDAGQYRVFGELGKTAVVGASYQRDETFGRWRSEALSNGHETTLRGGLNGSVGWMQGHAFAARRIDDSFIVVDTDGQADVPVFFENRYAGKTDRRGKLMLPDARAYQTNLVSIDAASLPIEYTLSQDQLRVVPATRGGARARFEISDGGILVKVRRADGSALPAGARALVSTQSSESVVGSRSEILINRARLPTRVDVALPGATCSFDYVPDGQADAANGGVATCR